MPWAAVATQELFVVYFEDSRLPYIDPALPPHAATALRLHRQRRNLQLETEVAAIAANLRLPHRARWTPEEALAAGLPDLPGEIDLIIADDARGRIWVCEVKDPEAAFAPAALRRHIERFARPGGYIDKLLAKAQAIAVRPAPAAAACGVLTEREWTIIPLMVTRTIEPSAFLDNPQVPFTVLADLPALLHAEQAPDHGHVRIGS